MRALTFRHRKRTLVKWALTALAVSACLFFVRLKKETLVRECTHFLESALGRSTGVRVHVGKVSGNLLGRVRFRDIEIQKPWLPEDSRTFFKAEEIQFRYRFLDFLSKRFDSKVQVEVKNPEIHWISYPGVRKKPAHPLMNWMREAAFAQRNNFTLDVEGLALVLGEGRVKLSGIDFFFDNDHFRAKIPLTHVKLAGADFTSVVNAEGHFELGFNSHDDAFRGQIRTEGTVINWQPLADEARFDFTFYEDSLRVSSAGFLGLAWRGQIDLGGEMNVDLSVRGENIPLANFNALFNVPREASLTGRFDIDSRLRGNWEAPRISNRTRIYRGWAGKKSFKAMDVNFSGVYPTVRLSDSRILLEDGPAMKFADKTLEMQELFKEKTYQMLITESQQDTFVWQGWEISRPQSVWKGGVNPEYDFLMQRPVGEEGKLLLKRLKPDADVPERSQEPRMEVGFEYHLESKDLLKLELREDEEFVGVERKVKF